MLTPQFTLPVHHELVVDLFAGGGGASTGIEPCVDLHEQLIALSTPTQMQAAYRATLARMQAGNVLTKETT